MICKQTRLEFKFTEAQYLALAPTSYCLPQVPSLYSRLGIIVFIPLKEWEAYSFCELKGNLNINVSCASDQL